MIDSLLNRLEHNCEVNDSGLSAFRIFFGVFILFFLPPTWVWIADLPPLFFKPPNLSLVNFLFDGFPGKTFFIFGEVIFILSLIFIIFGIYTRLFLVLAGIIGLFFENFAFSLGKIDHNILLWALFFVLAYTNCGVRYSLIKQKPISRGKQLISLGLFGLAIVFAFFSAGFHKSLNWIDFDLNTSGFLRWFYSGYFSQGRDQLLSDIVFYFPNYVLELMDYTAVLFELIGFLFLIYSRSSWRSYLVFAMIFHLLNLLLLNINFSVQILVYAIFLLPPFLEYLSKLILNKNYLIFFKSIVIFQASLLIAKSVTSFDFNFKSVLDYNQNFYNFIYIIIWLALVGISIYYLKKRSYNL